jgi:hypothetical protein
MMLPETPILTVPVDELKTATGEAADPLARSVFANAAGTFK